MPPRKKKPAPQVHKSAGDPPPPSSSSTGLQRTESSMTVDDFNTPGPTQHLGAPPKLNSDGARVQQVPPFDGATSRVQTRSRTRSLTASLSTSSLMAIDEGVEPSSDEPSHNSPLVNPASGLPNDTRPLTPFPPGPLSDESGSTLSTPRATRHQDLPYEFGLTTPSSSSPFWNTPTNTTDLRRTAYSVHEDDEMADNESDAHQTPTPASSVRPHLDHPIPV